MNWDPVVLGAGGAGFLTAVKDVGPDLFYARDASIGWTIEKLMPAISTGSWMVSSGYIAGIAAAKYISTS